MPHTYADLLALVDAAEIVLDSTPSNTAAAIIGLAGDRHLAPTAPIDSPFIEAPDDPHRLARLNLERYATRTDGRTLRYWRDEWYVWKRNCYRQIGDRELRAKITAFVRDEFERIYLAEREAATSDSKDSGTIQKVTMPIVSGVIQATTGIVCLSGDTEPNTWLPTKERRRYVSMANGLLDLDALLADADNCLLPNTPDWFSFSHLPYPFDPKADCPRWRAFLHFNLANDTNLIAVAQEWAGYLLICSTNEQKFMILEGEGQNGKSVFIAGLAAMLGGEANVSRVPLELFGDKFQLYSTLGKLLNAAADCGELDKSAEGILKTFTSGDPMRFDRKGLKPVDATPTARLMIACNNLPRFSDRTDGVWRRMLLIPFTVRVPDGKRVKGMDKPEWWVVSGELPGMFVWAVQGLAKLLSQGDFTHSDTMTSALKEYKAEMNPAKSFLEQYLEVSETGIIRCSEAYRLYKKWSEENGYRPLSERPFGKEIARMFKSALRVRRGNRAERYWAYEGVQFSQDDVCGEKTSDATLF